MDEKEIKELIASTVKSVMSEMSKEIIKTNQEKTESAINAFKEEQAKVSEAKTLAEDVAEQVKTLIKVEEPKPSQSDKLDNVSEEDVIGSI